jgi:Cd2+/Zn2+-exporting ATPase
MLIDRIKLVRLCVGTGLLVLAMVLERVADNGYVSLGVYLAAFVLLGGDIVWRALKNLTRGQVFDENFLMSVATIGAFVIGENAEAAAVMLFYQVGESFMEAAVHKSKRSISALMDIRPDYANLIRGDNIEKVSPDIVSVGDFIVVKPGEKIPLDGIIMEGKSSLDTSMLTGESLHKNAQETDTVFSGCVNQSGKLTIKVTKTFAESTVSKILDLVENASSRKAKTENFITTFARYYTPVVVSLAALLAVLPPLFFGFVWQDWIHRGLIFLVISCPCALVLSIPLGFFAGIGRAAKSGILVKGGNFLEAFNSLEIAVFDKTGTLTKGNLKVTSVIPQDGLTREALLELAAYAESFSNHPIALSVMEEFKGEVKRENLSEYTEHPGYGISVNFNGSQILAGNNKLMEKMGIPYSEPANTGIKVYIAKDGIFAGCLIISDEIKPDTKSAISALKQRGAQKTVMLTGDNQQIAEAIASEAGIDEVYAGLLPHEKVERLEMLKSQTSPNKKIAFTGDGINDAPVLAMSDIGIAMGALGSDSAIEAADVVLMTDELSKLPQVIDIAKFTRKIVWQNIVFALSVKTAFLLLGALGIAGMWEAVFADVGVSLLAFMNAMRIFRLKFKTQPS